MLHWSTKPCRETKLASRIPLSQKKKTNLFKMNRKPNSCNVSSGENTKSVYKKSHAFGISDSENDCKSSQIMQDGAKMQRNIERDVFDWLSRNNEKSEEYGLDNNSNAEDSTTVGSELAAKSQNVENVASEPEAGTMMSGRENGLNAEAESYFGELKSVIFPFEDKYFSLSEKRNNSQKVSVTETTNTTGDNVGYSMDDGKYKEIFREKGDEVKNKGGLKSAKVYKGEHVEGKNNYVMYRNKSMAASGGRDTALYNEKQCMFSQYMSGLTGTTMCNGGEQRVSKLKSGIYSESQQKEIDRLQVEIEKLSSFVESSDEHRVQSEALVAQQKEELLKQIREKEVLDQRVRCLEELRSTLQSQVDEILEENKSLKLALKCSEETLLEETENVKALKKDCASETAKNIELELVLQTIREELGYASSKNDISPSTSHDVRKGRDHSKIRPTQVKIHVEKKVQWGGIAIQSEETKSESPPSSAEQSLSARTLKTGNHESQNTHAPYYSCLKQQTSNEGEMWKHEKRQFQGKMMLLEMDKKKLHSQLEALEEKIAKHERIGENLQESNEVLEFRILELECELKEKR